MLSLDQKLLHSRVAKACGRVRVLLYNRSPPPASPLDLVLTSPRRSSRATKPELRPPSPITPQYRGHNPEVHPRHT